MTANEFAQLVGAKRVKRGIWLAKCPSHSDSHPSLSIAESRKAVHIKCISHGCTAKEIVSSIGLKMKDLFYDSELTDEMKLLAAAQCRYEKLRHCLDTCELNYVICSGRRKYWGAAVKKAKQLLTECVHDKPLISLVKEFKGCMYESPEEAREIVLFACYMFLIPPFLRGSTGFWTTKNGPIPDPDSLICGKWEYRPPDGYCIFPVFRDSVLQVMIRRGVHDWFYLTELSERDAVNHERIEKRGFDWMWEQYLATPKGKADAEEYGLPIPA